MITRTLALVACAAAIAVALATASAGRAGPRSRAAANAQPDSLVVAYRTGSTRADHLAVERASSTRYAGGLPGGTQELQLVGRRNASETLAYLRSRPDVRYAVLNYRVHAAEFVPNDPGNGGTAGWENVQWNFVGPNGINALAAWQTAIHDHAPGGRGATVAVIDSGVAFENYGRLRRSPDLARGSFVAPYDFLRNNSHPDDLEGHGTHVASTIVEQTNNGRAVTGLAYGAHVMPLRVLDANGDGDGATVARAIRYAADHHVDVINLSVEFDTAVRAADIPDVIGALRYAYNHGVMIAGAAGNEGSEGISYPAASRYVIAVGASTADGCLADYSNYGSGLALVAPGGGADAPFSDDPYDTSHCDPTNPPREIVQENFAGSRTNFRLVGAEGTSFGAPDVSAAAALLIATHRLGRHPSPAAIKARLMATARQIGPGGRYGAGLLDVGAALGP